jgi:hypothetical protein
MRFFLYAAPSLVVGLASGFQGIAERYTEEAGLALRTNPAKLYLLTRGLISLVAFVGIYSAGFFQPTSAPSILLYSAGCGLGLEIVLRSRITIIGGGKPDKAEEELVIGLFDLVKWYQNRWLKMIGKHLPRQRLKVFFKYVPQGVSLAVLCDRVQGNLAAISDPEERKRIERGVINLKLKYDPATGSIKGDRSEVERRYRTELASLIYHPTGGQESLRTLFHERFD